MLKNYSIIISTLFFICSISMCEVSVASSRCMGGKSIELKNSGFTGPVLCNNRFIRFKLIGNISGDKYNYLIYDYRYRFTPKGGRVIHGGQRLIIFDSNDKYLGQYSLTLSPNFDVTITGEVVELSINGTLKGSIDLSSNIPPAIFVDGENLSFFK